MRDSLGVYISVPFCRAKCTYCNFASGVVGAGLDGLARVDRYVDLVCDDVRGARTAAERVGAELPGVVDTIYFGGGTPSLLLPEQVRRVFAALRGEFDVRADAEVTLECAPGQLDDATLEEMLRQGMNRISFGVQSFVDAEARAVGRTHTREMCLSEIARTRAAGVEEINVDLIAGLPRQTEASWRESVEIALETGVPHVSVYMLEVDEDSRLGREVLGNRRQGTGSKARYGADSVPDDDAIAEWYGAACEWLGAGGVQQYEISNFARIDGGDHRSRHNMKYWRREPYMGFGLDAHSMLRSGEGAVRWANPDDLGAYEGLSGEVVQIGARAGGRKVQHESVDRTAGFEEAMFLGLRMNEGVHLHALRQEFEAALVEGALESMREVEEAGLLVREGGWLRLTAKGRMVSNEVFGRLLVGVEVD